MARRGDGGEGLHLFLRHAGRGGADRGGRAGASSTPIAHAIAADREVAAHTRDIRDNPGISVKLSALSRATTTPAQGASWPSLCRAVGAARDGRKAGIGFNIDAEEADRLDLSLDVIEAVLADPGLAGWDGFGVVVQAYGARGRGDRLALRAGRAARPPDHGAAGQGRLLGYRDQARAGRGAGGFPGLHAQARRPMSYIACARMLLGMTDRIYPQFATHNAHTCRGDPGDGRASDATTSSSSACTAWARRCTRSCGQAGTRCRIYAPVGRASRPAGLSRAAAAGKRREFLLRQPDRRRRCPAGGGRRRSVRRWRTADRIPVSAAGGPVPAGARELQGLSTCMTRRRAAAIEARARLRRDRLVRRGRCWPAQAAPGGAEPVRQSRPPGRQGGHGARRAEEDVARALDAARGPWSASPVASAPRCCAAPPISTRPISAEIFALLAREAGKTLPTRWPNCARRSISCATTPRARGRGAGPRAASSPASARGTSRSPSSPARSPPRWPRATRAGQTGRTDAAHRRLRASELLHEAGVPRAALQLLPGDGPTVIGAALTSDPRIDGVCLSPARPRRRRRSTRHGREPRPRRAADRRDRRAQRHDRRFHRAAGTGGARHRRLGLPVGGPALLGAALPLCAGGCRRPADPKMLFGAMDALASATPGSSTPISARSSTPRRRPSMPPMSTGRGPRGGCCTVSTRRVRAHFVGPALIRVDGIGDLEREVFGPVLHVATFKARGDRPGDRAINATGYGLTFGLHTRIDDRVQQIVARGSGRATSMSTATRSAPSSAASPSAARGCRAPGRRRAGRWRGAKDPSCR
jgi:RHH-type proline utilization regulon transcriptional repressor/proline dehydrogenase/delta 1-pyrroline-5-carboxylate dehydrogenase